MKCYNVIATGTLIDFNLQQVCNWGWQ